MSKSITALGFIGFMAVLFIVGIMINDAAEKQSKDTNEPATQVTRGIGNAFIGAGILCVLVLLIIGLSWIYKRV